MAETLRDALREIAGLCDMTVEPFLALFSSRSKYLDSRCLGMRSLEPLETSGQGVPEITYVILLPRAVGKKGKDRVLVSIMSYKGGNGRWHRQPSLSTKHARRLGSISVRRASGQMAAEADFDDDCADVYRALEYLVRE